MYKLKSFLRFVDGSSQRQVIAWIIVNRKPSVFVRWDGLVGIFGTLQQNS